MVLNALVSALVGACLLVLADEGLGPPMVGLVPSACVGAILGLLAYAACADFGGG